jgi:hypothetical protein
MMATVQNIIDRAATIYPTSRSAADQILSLARIQRRLYTRLGLDSEQYTTDESDVTVADQEEYDLPSDCQIFNIVNMTIEVETVESSGEYDEYKFRAFDEISVDSTGNYFTRGSTSSKYFIYESGEIIDDNDRTIRIRYYPDPTIIDSADDTPTLSSMYHDYFIYMLAAENAACGTDPDVELANYWRSEAEEYYNEMKYRILDNFNNTDTRSTGAKEYM